MKPTPSPLPPEMLLGQADFVGALSRSLLADPHAADDVAQDTLVAALEAPPSEAGALRGWLARVVRNFALQRGRSEQRRTARENGAARPESIPSTADVLERESARAAVVRAVLELDEPFRTAVLLRFYENRPPREIAELLRLPIDTVHTRMKRALVLLRARLDREFGSRSAWAALLIPFTRLPLVPTVESASPPSSIQRKTTMQTSLKLAAAGLALVGGAAYWLMPAQSSRASSASLAQSSAAPVLAPESIDAHRPQAELGSLQREALSPSAALAAETITPPADERFASGSLHLSVTWSDGTPAAGVHANVQDVGRSDHDPLTGLTDAQGQCTIAGLRAGKCWVTLDRKEYWDKAMLVAGETTELAIQLEAGYDVQGVVVDEDQQPVAGATVWSGSIWGGSEQSFALATSAADGSFTLRSCARLASIWARADGHAPSLRRTVEDEDVSPLDVTLTLGGEGATVTGRVLDSGGEPVEGALVLVDGQDMLHAYPVTLPDGRQSYLSHSGPTTVRTGADGRFSVAGVMPGTVPLGVLASGFAAWRGSVAVAAGATGDKEITLAAGFRLSGTVRDAAGNPVAARVRVWAPRLSTQLSPTVMTGPDGAFELDGISPGEIWVDVDTFDSEASTTLTGQAGDALTWDAILGPEGETSGVMESQPWE